MTEDAIEERLAWTQVQVDAEIREIELGVRALEARRAVAMAAAESLQVADVDGHRSLKAYVRATTNQSSATAHAQVRGRGSVAPTRLRATPCRLATSASIRSTSWRASPAIRGSAP